MDGMNHPQMVRRFIMVYEVYHINNSSNNNSNSNNNNNNNKNKNKNKNKFMKKRIAIQWSNAGKTHGFFPRTWSIIRGILP